MFVRFSRQKHLQTTAAILSCICLLYLFYCLASSPEKGTAYRLRDHDTANKQSLTEVDSSILERLGIQQSFEFRRYCIKPKKQKGLRRQRLVDISHELSTAASTDLLEASAVAEKCQVSTPPPQRTHEISFSGSQRNSQDWRVL
jgi:hypothetical protein